jgi:hypothetical protein
MVVAPPEETWPLPWSLREYERVGYWTDAAAVAGIDIPNAPFVIAGLNAAEKLGENLEGTHQAEFYGLRPEVHLVVFIRRDLWEAYLVRTDKQETTMRWDGKGHP